jgi:hypothetical protein
MNKTRLFIVGLLFVSACDASAQREPGPDFKKAFESISAKNARSLSFRAHIQKMSPLCAEPASSDLQFGRMGNVKQEEKGPECAKL